MAVGHVKPREILETTRGQQGANGFGRAGPRGSSWTPKHSKSSLKSQINIDIESSLFFFFYEYIELAELGKHTSYTDRVKSCRHWLGELLLLTHPLRCNSFLIDLRIWAIKTKILNVHNVLPLNLISIVILRQD